MDGELGYRMLQDRIAMYSVKDLYQLFLEECRTWFVHMKCKTTHLVPETGIAQHA